jgi:hypothetical protein
MHEYGRSTGGVESGDDLLCHDRTLSDAGDDDPSFAFQDRLYTSHKLIINMLRQLGNGPGLDFKRPDGQFADEGRIFQWFGVKISRRDSRLLGQNYLILKQERVMPCTRVIVL